MTGDPTALPFDAPLYRAEWGFAPLRFRLVTDDAALAARAQLVFCQWDAIRDTADSAKASLSKILRPGSTAAREAATLEMKALRSGASDGGCQRGAASDVGGWLFSGTDGSLRGYCDDVAAAVRAAEVETTHAVVNRPDLFLTVHAALVATTIGSARAGGILIFGPSGSGKSTLAAALASAGWALLGDDVALLERRTNGDNDLAPRARALPRRVSLRNGARAILGAGVWRAATEHPQSDQTTEGVVCPAGAIATTEVSALTAVDIRAAVFLSRNPREPGFVCQPEIAPSDGGEPETAAATATAESSPVPALPCRIDPIDALVSAAAYTNLARFKDMGECLELLRPILGPVPCFDLERGPLAQMVSLVKSLVAGAAGEGGRTGNCDLKLRRRNNA